MENVGVRAEFCVYQRRIKKDKEEDVRVDGLNAAYASSSSGVHEYALAVWQVFNKKHKHDHTIVKVQSPFILRAFRDVAKSHPTLPFSFNEPFELESPFQMLIHHWDDLEAYHTQTEDDDVRLHLGLLFEFMKSDLGADREAILAMTQKSTITFATLWAIFKPGELLYAEEHGHPRLYRCTKAAYEEYSSVGKLCHVEAQYTEFDGGTKGNAFCTINIRQKSSFSGDHPCSITALPIYPLKYWSTNPEDISRLQERLDQRGRRFLSIDGVRLMYYSGVAYYLKQTPYTWFDPSTNDVEGLWRPFTETGRVVLDRTLFDSELVREKVNIKRNDNAEAMLAPPFSYGYSPDHKDWCRYYVDLLSDVTWKPNAWDQLLLKDSKKRILKALVQSHVSPDDPREQAEQKGKGLVILLHGSPGSGKTHTAATSAEATRNLLLATSLNDLNRDKSPLAFETRLKAILHYVTRWKAILLLDEADVFLEKRSDAPGNQERNALVAVFLKNLEFFSGIVFLTTNRVRAFDPAMKSRIHLALEYPPPGLETRRLLWMKYLEAIPADQIDMDINEDIDELLPEKLNGREISYAVHTAQTLARFERGKLHLDHIRAVVEARQEFDKSLKNVALQMAGTGGLNRVDSILHDETGEFHS